MNTPPTITLNGKKYTVPKPKIKLWRNLVRFYESQTKGELSGEAMLDEMFGIIVLAFGNAEITVELVEENMDFEELVAVFNYISEYVTNMVNNKAAHVPNAKTPAEA
ncbi:MAG: hypothetical protein AB1815_02570 [Bacillota bacterium]